ncbi:phosphoribosyltransferase [Rhodovulum kholense]|uniref:Putative phosphoribosyltransferase n=1 Tax=Rhodovulum kholense TaxID=453584 RepID=A0A8E2VMV4_9RHOB|nr:phosphoribosyltransferase family protein [Rhodovulum kholense]PTW51523.1 putative phosphoribosyltransferase [Rhodovulum kholense]
MFQSREAAGRLLAEKVLAAAPENPVVLALPRGGVPVAAPVAAALGCPLDLTFVRKIGMPGNPELAAGAVVDGAAREVVFNAEILAAAGLTQTDLAPEVEARLADIAEARRRILGGRTPEKVSGRTAIVVDDGLATGATARAALRALHNRGPLEVWLAVPVGPQETVWKMRGLTDRLIFLEAPRDFVAVGAHYADFTQVDEAEVARLLQDAEARR